MKDRTDSRSRIVCRGVLAALLLMGLAVGCQRQPAAPSDDEALKRELEKLNQEREREWKPKQ